MLKKILKTINDVKRKGFLFALKWVFWGAKLKFLSLLNKKFVYSKYNIKLTPNYSDATFKLYVFGAYGFFYSDYLSKVSEEFVFVDVGANQGLYTILSSKNNNCKKVLAFEPIDGTFSLLNQNISLNQADQKCETHKKAIDSTEGVKSISFDKKHSGNASLFLEDNSNGSVETIETINKDFLNGVLNQVNENIYLKVDVEGFEYTVLSEVLKIDKSDLICSIFYEVNIRWVNPVEVEELLKKYGFNNFQKIGNSDIHFDVLATRNLN